MNPIKEYRFENGITQAELAARIGANQNTVSQYENGKRLPNVRIAHRLSEVLECSVKELLKEMEEG